VFSTTCNFASIIKIASKWLYLQSGKNAKVVGCQVRQVGWVGDGSHVPLWSKIPWRKQKCEMVCCHDATSSYFVTKVHGEVFAAVCIKCHSSMKNWLFGLLIQILGEQSSLCQRKWWTCFWLCSSLTSSGLGEFGLINSNASVWIMFPSLSNCLQSVPEWKKSERRPAGWNFLCWFPRYASTTLYHCTALLQLLYRWQHQSQKLWINILWHVWRRQQL
jgi:hypothetical protein